MAAIKGWLQQGFGMSVANMPKSSLAKHQLVMARPGLHSRRRPSRLASDPGRRRSRHEY